MEKTVFTVSIAGIGIRFEFPFQTEVPQELRPFLADGIETPVTYRAELHRQLRPWGEPVLDTPRQKVFRTAEGWLRMYNSGAAVLLTPEGSHRLLLTPENAEHYRTNYTITPLLGAEYVLARQGRLLLHSSAVSYRDVAILFSGPSGIGKSTQAQLWQQYAGAEVVNGDRCVISQREGSFCVDGSPFCGSSGIRRQLSVPIGALVFLEQGEENSLQPVSCLDAYRRLYSQIIANPWDSDYTGRVCAMIEAVIRRVPMYLYRCRPDASAVEALKEEFTNRQIILKE